MNKSSFKPAWWLANPHLQTVWPVLFRRPIKNLSIKRERLELPDGDFVDLDWAGKETGPIVLLLHGLEGSINSLYAQGMLQAIVKHGWRGVLLHFRGCSGEMNRLPRLYHSGETTDLDAVVEILKKRDADCPMAAVGFSLGGNVLLKWLGETGQHNKLVAAVAVSVPFELQKSVARIDHGFSRIYQKRLLNSLRKKINKKFLQQHAPIALPSLINLRTLREFDDKVTAPLHGFANATEYYAKSSSRQYLHAIRIPTLLLQAKDDPFMTQDLLPETAELSPQIIFEKTARGGHVGFVAGKFPWRAEYWLEKRVPEFLRSYL